jgi:hypothetical protein
VIRMFHCLFIVLKISLFSMLSSHDPLIRMFHCLFIVWESHCSPCHPVMIQWSECFIVFSLFWKSHCSPCHPVTIQWSECSTVFSLFSKSHLCYHLCKKSIAINNSGLIYFYYRGLYLGFMKLRTSVDAIHITVPRYSPNILPHVKVRDNPHVSR